MSGLVCFDIMLRSFSFENNKYLSTAYKSLGFTATKDGIIRDVRDRVCIRIHVFILKLLSYLSYDNQADSAIFSGL